MMQTIKYENMLPMMGFQHESQADDRMMETFERVDGIKYMDPISFRFTCDYTDHGTTVKYGNIVVTYPNLNQAIHDWRSGMTMVRRQAERDLDFRMHSIDATDLETVMRAGDKTFLQSRVENSY